MLQDTIKCKSRCLILFAYFPIILCKTLEKSYIKQVSFCVDNKCKLFYGVFKDSSAHFRLPLVAQALQFFQLQLLDRTLKATANFITFVLEKHKRVAVQV